MHYKKTVIAMMLMSLCAGVANGVHRQKDKTDIEKDQTVPLAFIKSGYTVKADYDFNGKTTTVPISTLYESMDDQGETCFLIEKQKHCIGSVEIDNRFPKVVKIMPTKEYKDETGEAEKELYYTGFKMVLKQVESHHGEVTREELLLLTTKKAESKK